MQTLIHGPDLCLCLDGLPDLLHTNALLLALVNVVGVVKATAQVTDMVSLSVWKSPFHVFTPMPIP